MFVFRFFFISFFLTGCATHPVISVDNTLELDWKSDEFQLVSVPLPEDIFHLKDDKKQQFLTYYHAPENQDIGGHKRLSNYIRKFINGFSYKGNTYNADLASTEHSGNCLSLAILTKAYASLVDLKVEYRRVNSAPIYAREGSLVTISSHVQTHVHAPKKQNAKKDSFYFAKTVIDYFPSSKRVLGNMVEYTDFVSMYYQNLAAVELANKDYDKAYSLLSAALELSPNNVETLNTLAVLYKKSGYPIKAESIYKYVLKYTPGSVSVLSNYVILLKQVKRGDEAVLYEDRYRHIEDDNPYRWYDIGNRAFANKKYARALHFFEKSSRMAPYLHENFYGQAKTYFQMGNFQKAKLAMERAVELAYAPQETKLYLAKLQMLGKSK